MCGSSVWLTTATGAIWRLHVRLHVPKEHAIILRSPFASKLGGTRKEKSCTALSDWDCPRVAGDFHDPVACQSNATQNTTARNSPGHHTCQLDFAPGPVNTVGDFSSGVSMVCCNSVALRTIVVPSLPFRSTSGMLTADVSIYRL